MRATYTFDRITHQVTKYGKCSFCGRRVRRAHTFGQTLNPYNRNAAGELKSAAEIRAELADTAEQWQPDFDHEACRNDPLRHIPIVATRDREMPGRRPRNLSPDAAEELGEQLRDEEGRYGPS